MTESMVAGSRNSGRTNGKGSHPPPGGHVGRLIERSHRDPQACEYKDITETSAKTLVTAWIS